MRKTCTSFLILSALSAGFTGNAQPCADPVNIFSFTYSGKTYEVVKEMKSWVDAAGCAVERGGYLVEINSEAEQDAVYDGIINGAGVSPTYTVVPDGGGIAYVWIGATDKQAEGTWLWDGNDDGSGTNFWNGEGAAGNGGGAAVGGAYVNWGGASAGTYQEPDDFGGGQDAAAIALDGWPGGSGILGIASEWNDISLTNSIYFVIEIENTGLIEQPRSPVQVFPNPAHDRLTVASGRSGVPIERLTLYPVLGISMGMTMESGSENAVIQTSSLSAGLYILRVTLEGGDQFVSRVEILK